MVTIAYIITPDAYRTRVCSQSWPLRDAWAQMYVIQYVEECGYCPHPPEDTISSVCYNVGSLMTESPKCVRSKQLQ